MNERQFSFGTLRGKGVCLIDFGCSIDTQVFPEEAMFVGSNETDAFQCPAMIEGRPWKWQVKQKLHNGCIILINVVTFFLSYSVQADYSGLAATFHVLLHGKYIEIQQEAETGLYQPKTKVTRRCAGLHYPVFLDAFLLFSLSLSPECLTSIFGTSLLMFSSILRMSFHLLSWLTPLRRSSNKRRALVCARRLTPAVIPSLII